MTIIPLRIRFTSFERAFETFHSFPPDLDHLDGWSRKRDGDSQVILLRMTDDSHFQEFINLCATNPDIQEVIRITEEENQAAHFPDD